MDIEPMAQAKAVKDNQTVNVGAPRPAVVDSAVKVRIPLPAGFGEPGETVYVLHRKADGRQYQHEAVIQKNSQGELFVEFLNENGFSEFEVTTVSEQAYIRAEARIPEVIPAGQKQKISFILHNEGALVYDGSLTIRFAGGRGLSMAFPDISGVETITENGQTAGWLVPVVVAGGRSVTVSAELAAENSGACKITAGTDGNGVAALAEFTVSEDEAQIGNTKYETLEAALKAVKSGETIALLRNVNVQDQVLSIYNGVTLDLNGKKLTAKGLTAFEGNHVVDNSAEKGMLIVSGKNISLAEENKQMAVYNGTGYVFCNMNMLQHDIKYINDEKGQGLEITFRPVFENKELTLRHFSDGAAGNKVQFAARLTYQSGVNVSKQDFVFADELVQRVYGSGQIFKLVIRGISASFSNVQIQSLVISDTGAEALGLAQNYVVSNQGKGEVK